MQRYPRQLLLGHSCDAHECAHNLKLIIKTYARTAVLSEVEAPPESFYQIIHVRELVIIMALRSHSWSYSTSLPRPSTWRSIQRMGLI